MILDAEIITREKFEVEHGRQSRDGMLFVLKGAFEFTLSGRYAVAERGDICVLCKDVFFDRRVLRSLRCIYVRFVQFPVALHSGLLRTADPVRTENTVSLLASAVELGDQELTEHLLRDLLLLYQRQHICPNTDETVSACIDWFAHHYTEHITLDDLAKRYALSKQGLIRKFRRCTGKTPLEYLISIRMARGKQLLRNTTLPIGEIARQCGFDNVYYFSNAFKHVTGVSPSAYRKAAVL